MKHLSSETVKQLPLPLPPLAEQERIVAAIEEEFSRLDAGVAALERARQNLKRIVAAVLLAGIQGLLTDQRQEDEPAFALLERVSTARARSGGHRGGVRRTPRPLFPTPAGWSWARWQDIAWQIGDVDHKMPHEVETGIPYVSPRDFGPNNGINFDAAKKISAQDFKRLAAKIRPAPADLIYPRYGTIGECRLVTEARDFLLLLCALVKTMTDYIDPHFQYYYAISPIAHRQALDAVNDTTQANVGLRSIQEFIVPVPPFAEQQRIADALARASGEISTLEEQIRTANLRANRLRTAILAAAFSGQLVQQDPGGEPASVLLDRIAADRSASKGDRQTLNGHTGAAVPRARTAS